MGQAWSKGRQAYNMHNNVLDLYIRVGSKVKNLVKLYKTRSTVIKGQNKETLWY